MTKTQSQTYYERAMWTVLALLGILGLLAAAGCGDVAQDDELTEDPDPALDEELDSDPAEESAFQAALDWQWKQSPRPAYNEGGLIDGFPGVEDELLNDQTVDPDNVEKGATPIIWGWAVKGPPQMQDGNTTGEFESGFADHCTTFGLACDNQPHAQALDLNYTGGTASDFGDDLQGRCGRFDSTVDNAWKPCILPYKTPQAKTWTWAYDAVSCGLAEPQFPLRDRWLAGIRLALSEFAAFTWQETTDASTAKLVFYCSFGELPTGKIALGYPYGPITLRYAADHIFDEWCESGVPGEVQLHAHHFADMYYTYGKGRVGINWADFWSFIQGCGGNSAQVNSRIKTIMMHEIGHVMGLAHAQLPAATNWMYPTKSCQWALTAGNSAAGDRYQVALGDYDITTSSSLTILDEDLSCYSPLGGGETPHD
jgi:hypothetical protein